MTFNNLNSESTPAAAPRYYLLSPPAHVTKAPHIPACIRSEHKASCLGRSARGNVYPPIFAHIIIRVPF